MFVFTTMCSMQSLNYKQRRLLYGAGKTFTANKYMVITRL